MRKSFVSFRIFKRFGAFVFSNGLAGHRCLRFARFHRFARFARVTLFPRFKHSCVLRLHGRFMKIASLRSFRSRSSVCSLSRIDNTDLCARVARVARVARFARVARLAQGHQGYPLHRNAQIQIGPPSLTAYFCSRRSLRLLRCP